MSNVVLKPHNKKAVEEMKEKVKEVMKFSGPRLIIYNPVELVRHALNK